MRLYSASISSFVNSGLRLRHSVSRWRSECRDRQTRGRRPPKPFRIDDIEATERNRHVNGCLTCGLALGSSCPTRRNRSSGVDHIRMALVVDHDAGTVVADIEVGVFELRDLDAIEITPSSFRREQILLIGAGVPQLRLTVTSPYSSRALITSTQGWRLS